jgi:O-antigen ligase
MRRVVYALSLVLIFTIPWEGALQSGLGTVATVMGIVVTVLWVALIAMTGQVRRPITFLYLTCIFVFWIALTAFWSADPGNSVNAVLRWIESLVFTFTLWDLYRTRREILMGLQAYVLGSYVAIGGAFANYLGSHAYYTHYERFSPGNTNPDGYGFTVALGVPMACYLAAAPETSRRARALSLAYLPVAFVGIALSGTRTASVAAAVGLLFGLALLTRLKASTRIAVVVLLASAMFVVLPIVQPLKSFERLGTTGTSLSQGDLNGRTAQWAQGFVALSEHPLFGVGTDQYRSVNTLDKVAHNSYLSVMVELGLVGFALFASILWIVFKYALIQPKWDRRFWLTLLAVWAIGASTLSYEHRKTTWLVLTLCVAAGSIKRDPPPRTHAWPDEAVAVMAEPGVGTG